jgi:hypothetical protein
MSSRRPLIAIFFVAVLALLALVASACVAAAPSSGTGTGAAESQPASLPLGIDPATYVIVTFQRTGGLAGVDERAQLYLDGHVTLERRGQEPATFQLSAAEQAQIEAAFESADFYRNTQQAPTPWPAPADAFAYELTRRGALLQGTLRTHDADVPAWAQSLLPLLDTLLLSPDEARVAAYQADVAARGAVTATLSTPLPAPDIVLVEFVRTGIAGEERLLISLDRSYSVARNGEVQSGQLAEEEMAALLKMLEAANLRERRGDYLPDTACESCPSYELIYRNLFGAFKVRSQEGAVPDWFEVISSALVEGFFTPDQMAASGTPALGAKASPTPLVVRATEAPATSPSATPIVAATPVPVTTEQPATTPPATRAYDLADLIGDLVASGARVAPAPGRIVKPYLSAPGVVLNVDEQPVQVFEYADEAALAGDVAGLAPDGSSIDGTALTWQVPPRFWRRGALLVLALTEDSVLVDRLSQSLGAPFAGPQ